MARERHENAILVTLFVREIPSKPLPPRALKSTQGVSGSNAGQFSLDSCYRVNTVSLVVYMKARLVGTKGHPISKGASKGEDSYHANRAEKWRCVGSRQSKLIILVMI